MMSRLCSTATRRGSISSCASSAAMVSGPADLERISVQSYLHESTSECGDSPNCPAMRSRRAGRPSAGAAAGCIRARTRWQRPRDQPAVVLDHQCRAYAGGASRRPRPGRAGRAARAGPPAGASRAPANGPRRGCRWRSRTGTPGMSAMRLPGARVERRHIGEVGEIDDHRRQAQRQAAQPGPGQLAGGRPAQVERGVAGGDVLGEPGRRRRHSP